MSGLPPTKSLLDEVYINFVPPSPPQNWKALRRVLVLVRRFITQLRKIVREGLGASMRLAYLDRLALA